MCRNRLAHQAQYPEGAGFVASLLSPADANTWEVAREVELLRRAGARGVVLR